MKKRLRVIIPILIVIIGGTIFIVNQLNNNIDPNVVLVSGNIEVTDARLSFKIPGRLHQRLVDEGDHVTQGQHIAALEKNDQKLALNAANANLEYAEAVLAELLAGSRPEEIDRAQARVLQFQYSLAELQKGSRSQEIAAARAELDRATAAAKAAQVNLKQAKDDLKRYTVLFKQGGISQREYELNQTRYKTALNASQETDARVKTATENLSLRTEGTRSGDIQRAKATLAQVEAEYQLIKSGPRKETIAQARAKVKAAEHSRAAAQQQLQYTDLFAPMDGVVLNTAVEPGEYLNPGSPVIALGDLKHPWLRAYITATDLGRVKLGMTATITTDSFPDKTYPGKLIFISNEAEFTPKTVQTFEERLKLMYRIKISLENPNEELKPGMPADARIHVSK